MEQNNLLVLICEDYKQHPTHKKDILDVSVASERLKKEGLSLTVNLKERSWQIEYREGNPFSFKCEIGNYHHFGITGLGIDYLIGVYDRNNTKHMQGMINSLIYKENLRHPCDGSQLD